ncbi:MAG: helix-turn-helix transcriptional regulator [Clostridia bacterium]|nr:helix-turn-helix transcriptional regulator [Clostridia bacterium]
MDKDLKIEREYSKEVGERLRTLRTASGMTQFAVAEKLGIERTLVAQWENGVRLPDVQSWINLATLFNVSSDFICGTSPQRTFKGRSTSDKLDIDKLNEVGRHILFSMYHTLLDCPATSHFKYETENN